MKKRMKVGIVGQRGMVGSVLMERMREENDFKDFDAYFFSTSQVGEKAPKESTHEKLKDAYNLDELAPLDIIITTQGSGYSQKVYYDLLRTGWSGYWIDAASLLRMEKDTVLTLDPVNYSVIDQALTDGKKTFVGSNCTVSLLLMAIGKLLQQDWVEWISTMTYQAASGAGAKNMIELLSQMNALGEDFKAGSQDLKQNILEIDRKITGRLRGTPFPTEQFGVPLAGSLIPWIDVGCDNGQTKEEWKASVEANKILGLTGKDAISIDGTCVRISAMRSHAQAATIKLKKEVPIDEIECVLRESHQWLRWVPNEAEATKRDLTPVKVSGSLDIALGRVRHMLMGKDFINIFTVGDQLLWGAAEPLRRILKIIINR